MRNIFFFVNYSLGEKDEHVTFLEINEKLESKMWNKFIKESK